MPAERLLLSDFNYHLPKELIAQYPCPRREEARLLVLKRTPRKIAHRRFKDFIAYLSPQDCLVLNNTRVMRARMFGVREEIHPGIGGGRQELFLIEHISAHTYRVLARPARKLTLGMKVLFNDGQIYAVVKRDLGKFKIVKFCGNGDMRNLWQRFGQVPLPPYIKREPQECDEQRYQTVYAQEEGSCASPTAGLHFTQEILEAIRAKGVYVVYLTLHINYGTFAPLRCAHIAGHKMHREYYILPAQTAAVINQTRARGKKVFAVGTTTVRVLETCARTSKGGDVCLSAQRGWTDIFIYPPYKFKVVDCLLTNFHFPKSTLLLLVSAFAGRESILQAYQEAIALRYRFFSYGDAMLIL